MCLTYKEGVGICATSGIALLWLYTSVGCAEDRGLGGLLLLLVRGVCMRLTCRHAIKAGQ